jgi:murein DD-endopeptidase MepM/ murein hydrolase activator NlpD
MKNINRSKFVIIISICLLLLAIEFRVYSYYNSLSFNITYESFDIKNISSTTITQKMSVVSTSISSSFHRDSKKYSFQEVVVEEETVPEEEVVVEKPFWHLPTEIGIITQNPHYSHVALDITSPRGMGEVIYPVADGVISSIYTDVYGALIVTILHDFNGRKYTSQYVHLSRYQNGIYVGKPVSYLEPIGMMGTTGYSTGVHLHLAVIDCALFDANDPYCKNLNGFFSYANVRASQGYTGLGNLIYVPAQWNGRI